VVVGFAALFIALMRAPSPEPTAPAPSASPIDQIPADESAIRLLGGLKVGDEVAPGWKVLGIYGPYKKRIFVELDKNGAMFMVSIGVKGTSDFPPPVELEVYDITNGFAHGFPANPEEIKRVTGAIADIVRKTEKTVPRPKGM
jgi:hypothetical protein